jgi:hypothetical protein
MKRAIVLGFGCMLLAGCGDVGSDDDELSPDEGPAQEASAIRSDGQLKSLPGGGTVKNCGACCDYDPTNERFYCESPVEYIDHAAHPTFILALDKNDPGMAFEWGPSPTESLPVRLPRGMSLSPLAHSVYLRSPDNGSTIAIPIGRGKVDPR